MTGLEIAIAAFNTLATAFAAFAAWRSAKAADKSVEAAATQKQLAQRQIVIQLWDRMTRLKPIDPKNPEPAMVHDALSTMELIGLCCEGGMVDASVIKRTFGPIFIRLCEMIKRCDAIPTLENKTGSELLLENRCAMAFYDELMTELKASGQLSKV
ncbi:DUF4760 domain-containing protein [Sorangium sp. So ce1000]|uniref:DUF4760 domain-containing protein n=1 Tax=unclassified Sorangium TaxID=2621164 RepID=UPI003F622466